MPGKERDEILNAVSGSVAAPLLMWAHCFLPMAMIYIIFVKLRRGVGGGGGGVLLCKKANSFAS